MNDRELEEIRQRLLNLRSELQEREGSPREGTQPVDLCQASTGRLSRRDAMQAQIEAEEGTRQRKRQLQKIDGALRRIQLDQYGKCFICEAEIEPDRISADPTVTRCMNCIEEE